MKTKAMKITMLVLAVAVIAAVAVACTTTPGTEEAYAQSYVTLSINPEVEMVTDAEGVVEAVYPVNEDAEILLADSELEGMTLDEAIDEILDVAEEAGYLDETTEDIEISVDTEDEGIGAQIRERVKTRVREKLQAKGLNCPVEDRDMSEYAAQASALGKSNAEVRMMARIMENDPTVTEDDLKGKTMSELATQYAHMAKNKSVNAALRQQFHTDRDALIAGNTVRTQLLADIEGLEEQLENSELTEEQIGEINAQIAEKKGLLATENAELVQQMTQLRTQYHDDMEAAKIQQKAALKERKQQHQGQGGGNQG